MYIFFSAIITLLIIDISAAYAEAPEIKFNGFVRSDMVFDSRTSARLRENAIMLYPLPENPDEKGDDIFDRSSMTMFVLHTRLRANIFGPDAFGAKTNAVIEGEFFGATDSDANGFRLRHAFVNLKWDNSNLLIGQYWNPMFITSVLPNFNFASPFLAYGRRPQVKFTQNISGFSIDATASFQSDFKSIGPDEDGNPVRSMDYIRNASMPMLNLNLMYKIGDFVIGANGDYKKLVPRIENETGATDEAIESYSCLSYLKVGYGDIKFKLQGIYGQNLADVVMLGGYALQATDSSKYTNVNILSGWGELSYNAKISDENSMIFSLFGGYTKNLGTNEDALTNKNKIYAMAADIDNVIRIAPSIKWRSNNLECVGEFEYTSAEYGSEFKNAKLEPDDLQKYSNMRVNLAAVYYF